MLLYQIVSGYTGKDIDQFIPYSTFYDLYKMFWIKNYDKLVKIVNKDLSEMFSNIKIRILKAQLSNPVGFKLVTLLIDDYDGKVKYYNPESDKKLMYSYKLKKPGIRTQIVHDKNKMILFISHSEKCAVGNDGTMFINMKLHRKLHLGDCIGMDGGYILFINKFKENALIDGYDFR